MDKNLKSSEELILDYVEIVKLSWKFPGVYDLTLRNMRTEFANRGLELPKVENPLEYL
jgi:hypothetical protein